MALFFAKTQYVVVAPPVLRISSELGSWNAAVRPLWASISAGSQGPAADSSSKKSIGGGSVARLVVEIRGGRF
jgi:hypothetical protein